MGCVPHCFLLPPRWLANTLGEYLSGIEDGETVREREKKRELFIKSACLSYSVIRLNDYWY